MATFTNQKIPSSVVEISLSSPSLALKDDLRALLVGVGIPEEDMVEYERGKLSQVSVYLPKGRKAQSLLKKLEPLLPPDVSLTQRILNSADWLEAWKKDIRPFRLTASLDVVPVWAQESYRNRRRRAILLDTTLAFGTGLHETTRFMAGLIELASGQFDSFLDVGTGSGLLAVVAFCCGARNVDVLDIDPHCLTTAAQNLACNGLAARQFYRGDFSAFSSRKKYDFVAANLFTQDLITLRKKLWQHVKPGKYLAISGISLPNLRAVRKAFGTLPLKCRDVRRGKKWAAVLYQRSMAKSER